MGNKNKKRPVKTNQPEFTPSEVSEAISLPAPEIGYSWLGWVVLLVPICIIAFVVLFSNHPWVAEQSDIGSRTVAEKQLILGREELKLGNLREAYAHYNSALLMKPDYAEAYVMISQLFYKVGQLDSAIVNLEKAISFNPPQVFLIYNNVGLLYAEKRQYDKALDMFNKSLNAGNQTSTIQKNIGNVYMSLKQYDNAIEAYQKAVFFSPDIKTLYSDMLHKSAADIFDSDEYQEQYKSITAHLDRGITYKELEIYDNGIIEEFIERTPKSAENYFSLAEAFHSKNDLINATQNYIESIKLNPTYIQAHNNLGAAYLQTGNLQKAKASFEEVLRLNPSHKNATLALDKIAAKTGTKTISHY